jgi:hypothetical protein
LPLQPTAVGQLSGLFATVQMQADTLQFGVDTACNSTYATLEEQSPDSWELIPTIKAAEKAVETLEDLSKQINKMLNQLYFSYIPADMDAKQLESFTTPSGTIKMVDTLSASVTDPEAAHTFFEEHGLGDIFQYTVHNATLRSQVGKLQEAGEEIPSCIAVTNSRRARVK